MELKIKLFGITREIIGEDEMLWSVSQDEITKEELLKDLQEKYPSLVDLRSLWIAVNTEYAEPEQVINEGDEVALIPPVSGG